MADDIVGEGAPCSCHCHQSVYCPECNQPVGPLEEAGPDEAAVERIWAKLVVQHPELEGARS